MLKVLFLLLSLSFTQEIFADELHLVINGKSIHENKRNYNEENWGLGFEYDFAEDRKWINFVNGGFLKDSLSNNSNYLGGGSKRRFLLGNDKDGWHIDAGLMAFIMTRKDHNNNQPFFGALPFVSIGIDQFAINAIYIPAVSPKIESLWFFQLTVKAAEW